MEALAMWPKMTASKPTMGMKENRPRIRLAVASPLLCEGCSGLAGGALKLARSTDSVEAGFSAESVCPHERQNESDASTCLPHFGQNIWASP
jgi:hypothetical protein